MKGNGRFPLNLRTTDSQARFDDIKVNGTMLTYLHSDHLGSNSLMSKNNGTMVLGSQTFYLPFGDYRGTAPNQTLTDRGYTGHKENMELGLIYMNARYYLPGLARFASADTIIPNPANPQNYNRYSYVLNSPLNYTDPTGHYETDCSNAGECGPVEEVWVYNAITYLVSSAANGNGRANFILDAFAHASRQPNPDSDHLYLEDIYLQSSQDGLSYVMDAMRGGYESPEAAWDTHNVGGKLFTLVVFGMFDEATSYSKGMAGAVIDDYLEAGAGSLAAEAEEVALLGQWCSFSEDTPVTTLEGLMPIGELQEWDYVLAYNEVTEEIGYYPVTAIWIHEDPIIVYLTIDGETIETTPEHPFYTAEGEWINAGALAIGDKIRDAVWEIGTIEAISFINHPQFMYNLTVDIAHTYFVGEGQWLVHNGGGPYCLQNGGHTLSNRTLRELNLTQEQGKYAIEALKDNIGRPNNFHYTKILSNGNVYHSHTGELLGNLYQYLP